MTPDSGHVPAVGVAGQIAPGVQRLLAPNPSPMTGPGTNSYVVGTAHSLIIDPGPDDDAHLERLAALAGPDVQAICLTHRHSDHAAGAAQLAARTGAPIRAWPKTTLGAHDIDIACPTPFYDGECLTSGAHRLTVCHSPGHAADHVVFWLADTGLLLAGDTLMQAATVVILPPDGHMGAYLATLERLRALGPARIAPAHGGLIDDARGEIERVTTHRLNREAQIAARVGDTPVTPEALVGQLYPDLAAALVPVAARQVLAHLIHLGQQNRVIETAQGWRRRD